MKEAAFGESDGGEGRMRWGCSGHADVCSDFSLEGWASFHVRNMIMHHFTGCIGFNFIAVP